MTKSREVDVNKDSKKGLLLKRGMSGLLHMYL